jgi:hypothetical protein
MKSIVEIIKESLSNDDIRNLDSIIRIAVKHYNVDIEKPFFFMSRIPKKKEFHIYPCQGREQLEQYYENTLSKPLEFGRFQAIRQTKEDLEKITKLWTFRKDHYKIIEEK